MSETCRICSSATIDFGSRRGRFRPDLYFFRHCPNCHYTFVSNPWTDYSRIYTEDYYAGKGADPLVDYLFEMEHPETAIRLYELRGILGAVRNLISIGPKTRWLDFGCGVGSLVQYCIKEGFPGAVGFEEGWTEQVLRKYGIPFLREEQLDSARGTFDVVTAIEVLEHLEEPLRALEQIRSLLRPGGLFFFMTGNARPFRDRFFSWAYVVPEVHISYFEPETLAYALDKTGFRPEFKGFLPGFDDLIRYKVLKTLHFRQASVSERIIPWGIFSRFIDSRYRVSAQPIAWAEV